MPETSSTLEAEIMELQKRIEEKRNLLEDKTGIIIEERDLAKMVIAEMASSAIQASTVVSDDTVQDAGALPKATTPQKINIKHNVSYLDSLDEDSIALVNGYLDKIPQDGFVKTIQTVASENPFILDAFHDALVDKLYDDLKASGEID